MDDISFTESFLRSCIILKLLLTIVCRKLGIFSFNRATVFFQPIRRVPNYGVKLQMNQFVCEGDFLILGKIMEILPHFTIKIFLTNKHKGGDTTVVNGC